MSYGSTEDFKLEKHIRLLGPVIRGARLPSPGYRETRKQVFQAPRSLSVQESLSLYRADQLKAALRKLDRMEKHYEEVAKLDASETRKRLAAASHDDLGALAYRYCMRDGADPRVAIAQRILQLIPIARRHVKDGVTALEVFEIWALNDRANMLLLSPHVKRSVANLADVRKGGRRKNAGSRDLRQKLALQFKKAKKTHPSLSVQRFVASLRGQISAKTLRRGLKDLGSH